MAVKTGTTGKKTTRSVTEAEARQQALAQEARRQSEEAVKSHLQKKHAANAKTETDTEKSALRTYQENSGQTRRTRIANDTTWGFQGNHGSGTAFGDVRPEKTLSTDISKRGKSKGGNKWQ